MQGPRSQIDREYYKNFVYNKLTKLKILSEEVSGLIIDAKKIKGVGSLTIKLYAKSVILTTGTFFKWYHSYWQ